MQRTNRAKKEMRITKEQQFNRSQKPKELLFYVFEL